MAYFNSTSRSGFLEKSQADEHIRGVSRNFMNIPGYNAEGGND